MRCEDDKQGVCVSASRRNGFTLLEFMVSMVIFIVMVGILLAAAHHARAIFQTSNVIASLQSDAQFALSQIALETQQTSAGQITITQDWPFNGTDTLTYQLPVDENDDGIPDIDVNDELVWSNSSSVIQLDSSGSGILYLTSGSYLRALARNCNAVHFIDHNIDSGLYLNELNVQIELEAQDQNGRTYSSSQSSIVNMRN